MTEAIPLRAPQPRVGMKLLSDRRLSRLAAGGDTRAFAAIYERYQQPLYRYCQALLGNPQDAQDALQNAMVSVLRALPGEDREIELKPWLYRIAHNAALDLIRKRRPMEELDPGALPAIGDVQASAETRARLRSLVSDLRELPERQRGAIVMRELGGMGFEEIGSAFETSADVARQTVYEARLGLQQIAEGREMECGSVKRVLSAGDGRRARGRAIRSHLRACEGCRDFQAGITQRTNDLGALSPLSAAAAAGLLQGIIGGGKGGSGGGGVLAGLFSGGAGQTVATSAALKVGAAVLAAGAIAVPVGQAVGAIHLPLLDAGSGSENGASAASSERTSSSAQAVKAPAPAARDSKAADEQHAGDGGGPPHQLPQGGPPEGLPSQASQGQENAAQRGSDRVPAAAKERGGGPPSGGSGQGDSPPAPPVQPPSGPSDPPASPGGPGGPGGYGP
jgi:RNA polymerase sigma factor (sigma-70 family)